MVLLPFIVKFIHHMLETRVSHAVMASAIEAVSKYHISYKDFGVNVSWHPLVTTIKKCLTTKTSTPKVSWHLWCKNCPNVDWKTRLEQNSVPETAILQNSVLGGILYPVKIQLVHRTNYNLDIFLTELYLDCLFPQNKELDDLECQCPRQSGWSHSWTY